MGSQVSPLVFDAKLSKKIDAGKALVVQPEELAMFVASGAIEKWRSYVSEYQRDICRKRDMQNRSISGENTNSSSGKGGTTKSSGTIPPQDVSEAEARAAETFE